MTTAILIIILLAFLAGLIAYIGDILGTIIGKRRLSLFGIRPKQTGRLIGVGSGILIMLTTIAVLALTFRQATIAFFNVQTLVIEARQLRFDRDVSQNELDSSRLQLLEQEARLAAIQEQAEALARDNEKLQGLNASLQELNESYVAETEEVNIKLSNQQNLALTLQQELDERAKRLTRLEEQIRAIEDQGLTYSQGQVIHSDTITAQDPSDIREALRLFILEAQDKAILRGASSLKPLSPDFTQALIEEISFTEGSDILTFSSSDNQFQASEVLYFPEVLTNIKIMDQGQLVSSQRIHLGSSQAPVTPEDVSAQLGRLSTIARSSLIRRNLSPVAVPEPSGLTTDLFAEQLLRLKGPVTIGVIANEDIYAAGPYRLDFAILY